MASTPNTQVDYTKVNYSKAPWAAEPFQTITYVSCHDDNTLFDRLKISNPKASEADLIKMDKLANAIVLTSQGVAFLHSGAEFLRTKKASPTPTTPPTASTKSTGAVKQNTRQFSIITGDWSPYAGLTPHSGCHPPK